VRELGKHIPLVPLVKGDVFSQTLSKNFNLNSAVEISEECLDVWSALMFGVT